MSLRGLVDIVRDDPPLAVALSSSVSHDAQLVGPSSYYPFALAALATPPSGAVSGTASSQLSGTPQAVLAVTATTREAEDLV